MGVCDMKTMFDILKTRYDINFVRIDQLKRYVLLKKITKEEFQSITTIEYSKA